MRSARQRLMINTNTTIDQDRRTEGNCVCVYTVHCRVIVDNKCGLLLRCSSHGDCNFDARLVINTRKYQQTDISEIRQADLRSPTQVQPHKKKNTRPHLAECESFKNSSIPPTDSCSTNPVCQLGQMHFVQSIQSVEATNCSCTNTAKS